MSVVQLLVTATVVLILHDIFWGKVITKRTWQKHTRTRRKRDV